MPNVPQVLPGDAVFQGGFHCPSITSPSKHQEPERDKKEKLAFTRTPESLQLKPLSQRLSKSIILGGAVALLLVLVSQKIQMALSTSEASAE